MIRVCHRCGTKVKKSQLHNYSYYCPKHDEDLYEFETDVIEEWTDNRNVRYAVKCFKNKKNREPNEDEKKLLIDIAESCDSYYDIETDINCLFNN